MTLYTLLALYLCFRAKQLVCDFFLQTSWIAHTKGAYFSKGGAKALALHAGFHALFTLVLMMFFAPTLWWLSIVDFVVHATIDKLKAAFVEWRKWTYNDTFWWWSLGIDQEAHNLTHLAYIVFIVIKIGFIS